MPGSIASLLALLLAVAVAAGQTAPDDPIAQSRAELEAKRREVSANLADRDYMAGPARATLVRLAIERNWEKCAETEGTAIARKSERPARLLAEAALTACQPWEAALVTALERGADPYVNGLVSREDMVAEARLRSRDAALARILLWRGVPAGPTSVAHAAPSGTRTPAANPPSILLQTYPKASTREAPAPAPAPDSGASDEIVVTGRQLHECRVRRADRTLSDTELQAFAKQWATGGTALRVVRPPGATYGCLAKIARKLNQYGVHLLQVVEP